MFCNDNQVFVSLIQNFYSNKKGFIYLMNPCFLLCVCAEELHIEEETSER